MPSIFDYLDYRAFLKDWFEAMKATSPRYSYRFAAGKIGCDPAFLVRVLQGKRNLSADTVIQVGGLLRLSRKGLEYLDLLVQLAKADTDGGRRYLLDRINLLRKPKARSLESGQYEYFDKWYYTTIRELLDFHPFRGNHADLAKRLVPPIKPSEARKAVEVLERLGLIRKGPDGFYERTDAAVTTGEGWRSPAIANYQVQTLDLARQALERFPEQERNIPTLTLTLSGETYDAIVENLILFRREALELARKDARPDRVCHLNFQVFPTTRLPKRTPA